MPSRLWGVLLAAPVLSFAAVTSAARAPADAVKITAIERATERFRGLQPTRPVLTRVLGDARFNAVLRAQIKRDTPNAEIALAQREERLLGLLGPRDNLRRLTYGAQVRDIIGVYDYITKKLYVRNRAGLAFGIDRYVLAHEYTHALQDQRFGLRRLIPNQDRLRYRNSDLVAAHQAFTEGDAVNTQYLYIARTYTRAQLRMLIAQQNVQRPPAMPRSMERENLFPYTTGYEFVRTLYARGGLASINAAYDRPPSSTYEIMYPKAYLRGWKPAPVSLRSVAGLPAWRQRDNDVLGAQGYELLFWQFLSRRAADRAVVGYRGDRYVMLTSGGRSALLFKSRWTTAAAANVARSTWVGSLRARWPRARVRTRGAATLVSGPGTAVYLRSLGATLAVAYADTSATAGQIGSAPTR